MASEDTKITVRSNMHLGDMVIEVTKFSSEVRSDLRGHYHSCPLVFRAIALLLVNTIRNIRLIGLRTEKLVGDRRESARIRQCNA